MRIPIGAALIRGRRLLEEKNRNISLFNIVPVRSTPYTTRTMSKIPLLNTKQKFFKYSFFPFTIIEWDNLDPAPGVIKNFWTFKE